MYVGVRPVAPTAAENGAGLTSPAARWTLDAADHAISVVVLANPGAEAAR